MQEALIRYIRQHQLMRAGDRVGVAVSGGADSVALLRLLMEARGELGVVLSVVHFNHKLRGSESEADEAFVRELAAAHGLEFLCDSGDTRAYAAKRKCGIEAAAREMRYGFFWNLLAPPRTQRTAKVLDRITTAHTMEDQAETVVLRIMRGAGTRGLAGIYPVLGAETNSRLAIDTCRSGKLSAEVAEGQTTQNQQIEAGVTGGTPVLRTGAIVRPLLEFRRAQLRHYLRRAGQTWREDASNEDVALARNKVRHELMPKLRELNPAVEMVLGETAEIARAEEEYWREVVSEGLREVTAENPRGTTEIDIAKLLEVPLAVRRRILRAVAEREGLRLEFHHVNQVLEVVSGRVSRAEKRVELTEGWDACVTGPRLRLERRAQKKEYGDYDFPLPVPGEARIESAGVVLQARMAESGPRLKVGDLRVRNWRPGDRYWPAHTASEKKVKELLQDRRVPAEARGCWPVVLCGEEIVWLPGFEAPERWTAGSGPGVALQLEYLRG